MNITFEELRRIKHALSSDGIHHIAEELNLDVQTVRNYFGAHKYKDGEFVEWHLEPGPGGGIVHFEDTTILECALQILKEHKIYISQSELQIQQQNDLVQQVMSVEEPSAIPYSTLDERKTAPDKRPQRPPKKTKQLDVFEQMEALRMKLRSISIPPNMNISQLANEVNNP
ncbi:MAG TPA: hypothetical protein PK228_09050 [Saprospiraceae bacterium]|nr:hypothetical protein [Saprospiraceae bacterium]